MNTLEMTEHELYEAGPKELMTQMGTAYTKRFLQLNRTKNLIMQQLHVTR